MIELRTFAATLAVTSYDANYSAYLTRNPQGEGIRFADAGIGVTGGFGVFGSAATILVPVTLVKR
jgi:hypothetical protein